LKNIGEEALDEFPEFGCDKSTPEFRFSVCNSKITWSTKSHEK